MPALVHISDQKNSARIKRSGIALGRYSRVVFFMPVVQDHFISHQWLRELRRGGARCLVGVYFRLPAEEMVWAGRYNLPHRQVPLGQAIGEMMAMDDPLGFEMFIARKIEAREITRIRRLPQIIGWRYKPHAHGEEPCGCPMCLPKGSIKSKRVRERYYPPNPPVAYEELKTTIAQSPSRRAILYGLWDLRAKRRKADPAFLQRLMTVDDIELQEELARTLGYFRHPQSRRMLLTLCEHKSAEVKEAAAESLVQLYRQDAVSFLRPLMSDPLIAKVLIDNRLVR